MSTVRRKTNTRTARVSFDDVLAALEKIDAFLQEQPQADYKSACAAQVVVRQFVRQEESATRRMREAAKLTRGRDRVTRRALKS